jgi:hypothetical protein
MQINLPNEFNTFNSFTSSILVHFHAKYSHALSNAGEVKWSLAGGPSAGCCGEGARGEHAWAGVPFRQPFCKRDENSPPFTFTSSVSLYSC